MKLFKLTTLTLMAVLSLTACDKAKDEKVTEVQESPNLLLDMTMDTLKIPMEAIKSSDKLTEEQRSCVEKIDLDSQKPVIRGAIEKGFTPEEIQQLNDFYAKPEVKKVTDYGREQLFKQMGMPIQETAEKPSAEEMKVVTDFAQTAIGQKYGKFNLSEDAQLSNQKVNTFIKEELDKCGLGEEKSEAPQ
ncbi:MAG: hypothetical protein KGV51_04040 [Moraxellaceae bacterium]|nr:hypothetical protein [Moraxellaceae bacterium]